jgi:NAD(P)H dehydrogenase (quinone)
VEAGGIANCAGNGRCGYTTRPELAFAYARLLTDDKHNGHTYNLHGESITQYELAGYLNSAFGTDLTYTPMTVEEYRRNRIAELGEFMGTVIAGIYQGIRHGEADNTSHYHKAAGRRHVSWQNYFAQLAEQATTS